MKITNKILTAILICMPLATWASVDVSGIEKAETLEAAQTAANSALDSLSTSDEYKSLSDADKKEIIDGAKGQLSGSGGTDSKGDGDKKDDKKDAKKNAAAAAVAGAAAKSNDVQSAQAKVDAAKANLEKAKATEQSLENRMLGGLTTAATGLGAMQLAQGLAEKSADSAADKDMDAYIATMRCTYGNDKSVKWSPDPIELPGGNDGELMKYRAEYLDLAASLKERKTALDLKPGIEAEEILDKATSGLYDDENTGITSGTYASRYRAAGGNEKDKKALAAQKKEAKTRMIAGGAVAGIGLVGGMVGNSLINGKLGELIKKNKDKKASDSDNKKAIEKLKNKASAAGLADPEYVNDMGLESYDIGNYITIIDQAVLKPYSELHGKYLRNLCPTPQIECADKLLTEESKNTIVGAVKAAQGKDTKGVVMGTISKKAKEAVASKTGDKDKNSGEQPAATAQNNNADAATAEQQQQAPEATGQTATEPPAAAEPAPAAAETVTE